MFDALLIPFLQALVTGLLFGLAGAAFGWLVKYESPGVLGVTVGTVAALLAWLAFRDRAARLVEHDKGFIRESIPEPPLPAEPKRQIIRIEMNQQEGRQVDYIDLAASRKQLYQLAAGLLAGQQFSVSNWTGSGKPFTRSEFETLRAELITRGLARWRNERAPMQGAELTRSGAAMVRYLASTPPPAEKS